MMKSFSIFNAIHPLYTFLAGSLGFLAIFIMLTWNYPLPGDQIGEKFVSVQPFVVWLFLLSVLGCLLTIVFLPLWGLLVHLIKNRIYVSGARKKRRTIAFLGLQAVILSSLMFMLIQLLATTQIGFDFDGYVPRGHPPRISILSIYTLLTTLPALLGIILIHDGTQEVSQKIENAGKTANRLLPLINELISLRAMLQNYLVILGLILSMIPISTAGLRAILIALDAKNEQAFPVTYAILYGLVSTLILLLIYIPTHLALSETSRKLRDHLCPLTSLESLKPDLAQRKALDELLQTNLGIAQNLRAGLITLAPMVAGLISSLLDLSVSL